MVNDNSLLFFQLCRMSRISLGTFYDTIQFEQRHTHTKQWKKQRTNAKQRISIEWGEINEEEEEEEEHQQQKYKYKRTNDRMNE